MIDILKKDNKTGKRDKRNKCCKKEIEEIKNEIKRMTRMMLDYQQSRMDTLGEYAKRIFMVMKDMENGASG